MALCSVPFSFLLQGLLTGIRVLPNPGWSHLQVIAPSNAVFPSKVTFFRFQMGLTFEGVTTQPIVMPSGFLPDVTLKTLWGQWGPGELRAGICWAWGRKRRGWAQRPSDQKYGTMMPLSNLVRLHVKLESIEIIRKKANKACGCWGFWWEPQDNFL